MLQSRGSQRIRHDLVTEQQGFVYRYFVRSVYFINMYDCPKVIWEQTESLINIYSECMYRVSHRWIPIPFMVPKVLGISLYVTQKKWGVSVDELVKTRVIQKDS